MNSNNFNEIGALFLKSVYNINIIEDFNKEIRDFFTKNHIYEHIRKKNDVTEETFFVNNTYSSLNNYTKMQHFYIPVIDNRGSHNRSTDVGMIDIYNADKLFPSIFKDFNIELIQTLLFKITNKKWKLLRTNIQICSNVTNSNSFHFENTETCIKFMIYLSDIINDDCGAPVYIEKSHNIKNNIKNENIKIFHGNKGDVLISYQNGFHRKLPQKNYTSGFLVFNFVV
jgi:predicted RNA-binding protein Jag